MWNWSKIYWFMTSVFKNYGMIPFAFLNKLCKDITQKNSEKTRVKESGEFG